MRLERKTRYDAALPMLSPLTKKLLRDLKSSWAPVATISLVLGLGIMGLVGFLGLYRDLSGSRDNYYRRYRYTHGQISVRRAPRPLLSELSQVPGVESLEARLVEPIQVHLQEPLGRFFGRLLSLPRSGRPRVNDLELLEGSWPQEGLFETLVIDSFAKQWGLRPGGQIEVFVGQQLRTLTITGITRGPEFVYVIPDSGGFLPDPKNTVILWSRLGTVEDLTAKTGTFNDLQVRAGRKSPIGALLKTLEHRLEPFGVISSDPRKDLPPFALLDNEIRLTWIRAMTIPTVFLAAAAMIMNLVLSRMIRIQRVQIGTLLALGVSRQKVVLHFASYAFLLSWIGGALGIYSGRALTGLLLRLYIRFYQLPLKAPGLHLEVALMAWGVASVAAFLGVFRGLLQVFELTPSEAMRPSPPELEHGAWIPKFHGFPLLWRIALRNLIRHPFRTFVASLGTMVGVGMMVTSVFFVEGISQLNLFRFTVNQRQDLELSLEENVGEEALSQLRARTRALASEEAVSQPVRLLRGRYSRRVLAEGIEANAWLNRPRTLQGRAIPLPPSGLLLGDKLAEILHARTGDLVEVETLIGPKRRFEVRVAGTYPTFMGLGAIAERSWWARQLKEPQGLSDLRVQVPADLARGPLTERLRDLAGVSRITFRADKIEAFQGNFQGVLEVASKVLLWIAAAITCGMLINSVLIDLADRRRELAIYRVQGFTRQEIGDILLYEHTLTGALGLFLGVPYSYSFTSYVHRFLDTEIIRVPYLLSSGNFARAWLWAIAFLVLSHGIARVLLRTRNWREDLAVKE